LNVLVLAQYFPPDIGGSATRVHNVAKGLTLNGCKVTVVAAFPHYPHGKIPTEYKWKPIKVEQMENFKVIRTFMPPIKSVGFFRRLVLVGAFAVSSLFALPFIGKVDAVWASSCCPGFIFSRVKRKPLALNVDDLTLEDLVDLELINENSRVLKIGEWIYRLFLVQADILTPISSGYFETLSKKYCVKPNKIHLVRGGVDLSTFKPNLSKSQHSKKFTVLYSGAFSVAYDFNQIFKAAKIIEKVDEDIEFVIQGTGELLGSMCESVRQLDVKNVKIINKILSRTEVAELLCQADILILPLATFYKSGKPYRGMSSKLYEYQAVSKPIICCSNGVPSTYLEETCSGLVVNPGDYKSLVKAILELKKNPALAQAMGENGRKYVESETSIESIGLKMERIFETINNAK
jgi:glycosyltransferase involved in cell wall biosynthesis